MKSIPTPTLALLTLALLAGCKQAVLCPGLGACGGERDPQGHSKPPLSLAGDTQEWVLAPNHPSCTEDLFMPASDTRLLGMTTQPTNGTMTPFPEPALFDWCLLLVAGPGAEIQRRDPRFYYDSGQIGVASIKFKPDFTFSADLTITGTYTLDFPEFCVKAFGAMEGPLNPSMPNLGNGPVCKRLEVPLRADGIGGGDYFNTTCVDDTPDARFAYGLPGPGDGGCLCRFDVTETGGPPGSYAIINDNIIQFIPGHNFPQRATFCQEGDRLQLTGADGTYLFDRKGLRTFDLVRGCTMGTDCASGNCNYDAAKFQGFCQ
jgi:hypothetical protein